MIIGMLSDALEKIVNFRRSNRSFDTEIKVPADVIKRSFGRASFLLIPVKCNFGLFIGLYMKSRKKDSCLCVYIS